MAIPSVDLRRFDQGGQAERNRFVDELADAFGRVGFVALSGHYLSPEVVDALYREVKAFFNLPEENKRRYEIPGLAGQRGYTPFGRETAKGSQKADLKEFWHFGRFDGAGGPDSRGNVEVQELPGFGPAGQAAFEALERTGRSVLRALALHLDLDPGYFDPWVIGGDSILRPIHYPPIVHAPESAVRAAAHGDINLITLLMGAHGKGLQVQHLEGEWVDAIARPEELMINVGDMLARLTNNRLRSTVHRVLNPPETEWGSSRYSVPFFMHPRPEMPLDCLAGCVDKDHPKAYEDTTAGAFLQERLVELGLAKPDTA